MKHRPRTLPSSNYWYICLQQDELFKQLCKIDYKHYSPTSEEGLSLISSFASKHPALQLVIFKELSLVIEISSGVIE